MQQQSRQERRDERLRGAATRVLQQEESLAFDTTSVASSESEFPQKSRNSEEPSEAQFKIPNHESRSDRLQERLRGAGARRPIQEESIAFDTTSVTSTESYISQNTESSRLPAETSKRQSRLAARLRGVARRDIDDISSLGIESDGQESESTFRTRHSIDNKNEFAAYDEDDVDIPALESPEEDIYQEDWSDDDFNIEDENDEIYDSIIASKKRTFEQSQEKPRTVAQRLRNKRRAAAGSLSESESEASVEDEQPMNDVVETDQDNEDVFITAEKVPAKYGGTRKINAVDVVADVVNRLLNAAVAKSQRRNVAPWAATAVTDMQAEIKRRLRSLTDIVDTNRALLIASKRSTHSRNSLRVRLLHLRRQRTEIYGEIHRIREQHKKVLREKLELREISRFIGDVRRLEPIPENGQAANLEAELQRLEPMFNKHYGTLQRVRELNMRMKELVDSYGR